MNVDEYKDRRSRQILHLQQLNEQSNLCTGDRGNKMKSGQSWAGADQQAAEEEGVCGATHSSPGPKGAGLLSIRSCQAAR